MKTSAEKLKNFIDGFSKHEGTIEVGDLINYRVNLVRVLEIQKDGVYVQGPYGEEQLVDWEDVKQYNPDLDIKKYT